MGYNSLGKKILLKSAFDSRQYLHSELKNGLRVLIVEDQQCGRNAVSATVAAGHFNDPPDTLGLSHLLEHMLFLGNKEFPKADEFSDFLAENGGSINAATGTEYTSYYFDIPVEHLSDSLCHFSNMLGSPIFDLERLDSEINTIDAEFKLKQKDDLRRLYQVHKETCNPAHPFSQFSVGNNVTLRNIDLQQLQTKLKNLHQATYRANNICLCLISNNALEDSLSLLEHAFSGWRVTKKVETKTLPPLYLPSQLGIQINIEPLKQAQRLIVTFALPGTLALYRQKPLSVISHMLGDEGQGSLLGYLKQQNWATNLSAGGGIEGSNFKDFNINLQLTKVGLNKIELVLNAIFYYLSLLKEKQVDLWRIDEVKILNQLIWDFGDQIKPIEEALKLSNSMFEYPTEHLLAGDYILDHPNPACINQLLTFFTPQNMRLKVVQPNCVSNQIANWYETPYSVNVLSEQLVDKLLKPQAIDSLSLPPLNPYIEIDVKPQNLLEEYRLPVKITHRKGLDVWFGQDHKFKQPKGDCFLSFDCDAVTQGLELVTLKRLWIAILNEQLNQQYYQANVAGLHFHLYPHQGGFSLQTNGFSARQLDFSSELIRQITKQQNFQFCFEQVREKQWQSLTNSLLNKPINRLFSCLSVIMQQHSYSPMQMASTIEKATLQDISKVKNKLLDSFHLEAFIYGDWQLHQASIFSEEIAQLSTISTSSDRIHRGVADLRSQPTLIHQVACEHKDAAVVIFFQTPGAALSDIALSILTEQLLAGPFFNQLRTKQQLGYLVGSGYIPFNQHPGMSFYIQSPSASARQLVEAIHMFLVNVQKDIQEFSTIWTSIKRGVIKQLQEKDTNLSMKSQRLWMAIGNKDSKFDHSHRLIQSISELEFESFVQFYDLMMLRRGFGELILYSDDNSDLSSEFDCRSISNIEVFKTNTQYLQ
ncbi:MAG: insulysin [Paraglaciecola sp.]